MTEEEIAILKTLFHEGLTAYYAEENKGNSDTPPHPSDAQDDTAARIKKLEEEVLFLREQNAKLAPKPNGSPSPEVDEEEEERKRATEKAKHFFKNF